MQLQLAGSLTVRSQQKRFLPFYTKVHCRRVLAGGSPPPTKIPFAPWFALVHFKHDLLRFEHNLIHLECGKRATREAGGKRNASRPLVQRYTAEARWRGGPPPKTGNFPRPGIDVHLKLVVERRGARFFEMYLRRTEANKPDSNQTCLGTFQSRPNRFGAPLITCMNARAQKKRFPSLNTEVDCKRVLLGVGVAHPPKIHLRLSICWYISHTIRYISNTT